MTQMNDLLTILPVLIVLTWALLLLVVDLWIPQERKGLTALLAVFGLAAALGTSLATRGATTFGFNQMVVSDGFADYLHILFLASGMVAIALGYDYLKRMQIERGEYYVLLLFSIAGMMLMAQAYNLLMTFLALELLSIPMYVLAGFAHGRTQSEESALKYFLMGAFASGFVLYGTAMIFGATGHIDFPGIVSVLQAGSANAVLFVIGAALLLVGFGFKVAAVPFQMWTPDVYQGAPTSISAFMSVAVKAAGFAALLRVFMVLFPSLAEQITPVLWVIAALTMLVGNVVAVVQTNLKRLLAYSSIAHAGYILMAFVSYGNQEFGGESVSAALFYLFAYGLASFGAWALLIAMEKDYGEGLYLEDLSGLGKRYPWLGLAMLVFMLSFAGVPLTMGFWGKFYLFRATIQAGFLPLALIGLVTSLISAFYYLRVVVFMFMKPGERELQINPWVGFVIAVMAIAVVGMAFFPETFLTWAYRAVMLLQ